MFTGLKRLAARFIYKSVSYSIRNAYESGATGRRLSRWMPAAHGPNSAVLNDLERIRNRARDQVRNNPWISRGIKIMGGERDRLRDHDQIGGAG